MEDWHETQTLLQAKIQNSFVNFKKKGQEKMTKAGAETRLESLEECYAQFLTNDRKIRATKATPKEHAYYTSGLSSIVEESYLDRKTEFRQYLDSLKEAEIRNQTPTAVNVVAAPSFPNLPSGSLPRIDIHKFSGRLTEWGQFKDIFSSLIHSREDIQPVLKFYYLRTYVEGDALNLIKNLDLTAENYILAWKKLKDNYDNKKRLVSKVISDLFSIKSMKSDSYSELSRLNTDTFDVVNTLDSLERSLENSGIDLLIHLTVSRFDSTTRKDWERLLGNKTDPPTLAQLKSFLNDQIATYESIENSLKNTNSGRNAQVKSHVVGTKSDERKKDFCPICKKDHRIYVCKDLQDSPVSRRKELVIQHGLCFKCLGKHRIANCKSKKSCNTCHGNHHSLLHISKESAEKNNSVEIAKSPESSEKVSAHVADTFASDSILLSTALVKVLDKNGNFVFVRALIDQCSQSSFITSSLCQRLGLPRSKAKVNITGVGGLNSTISKGLVELKVYSRLNPTDFCFVKTLILPKITNYEPKSSSSSSNWLHLKGLYLADPRFDKPEAIEMLLGSDIHAQIVQEEIVKGNVGEPIATKTMFGWMISGSTNSSIQETTHFHCVDNSMLYLLLENFWKQENLDCLKPHLSSDEKFSEEFFTQNFTRERGRYVVRLPFKKDLFDSYSHTLYNSYDRALKTFLSMERKFELDQDLKEKYCNFMLEYESLGHMELLKDFDFDSKEPCCFLPHHGVIQGKKKLRTVFNGSSKIGNVTLNDLLLPGPNLIPDLFSKLMFWRKYKFVFITDIEKMFRQVLVDSRDRRFQLILWRQDKSMPIQVYSLKTVTYGLNCSPFLAIRSVQQLAKDHGHDFPLASKIVLNESYVDDFMSGGDTIQETLNKQKQLLQLLKVGGFPLRKWAANCSELEDWIPAEDRIRESSLFESHDSTSILGLSWSPVDDSFQFKVSLHIPEYLEITKRNVLSAISKLFDPLGWLSPVLITAKIFMQSLWLIKCDWDDVLPVEYRNFWLDYYPKLKELENVRIPRWIGLGVQNSFVEIHGFADASSKAYGAVVYLRVLNEDGSDVYIQCSKTKVAPIKTLSIPRLELSAAHLLTKLVNTYVKIMNFSNVAIHLWSDSKDVLFWIRAQPSRWQTFVANRCSDIQTLLPNAYWHHVKSQSNPADLASRGIESSALSDCLWWKGPSFLCDSSLPWPTSAEEITCAPLEEKKSSVLIVSSENSDCSILDRFSSATRLFRVTAWCLRFIRKISIKIKGKNKDWKSLFEFKFMDLDLEASNVLSNAEIRNSELLWIHLTQKKYYSKEIDFVSQDKPLKDVKLIRLRPFLDRGLLRIGGRLRHSILQFEEKFPLILPFNCHLTTLLIRYYHQKCMHGGTRLTLSTIRTRYWIVKGGFAVKKVISKCIICLRYSFKSLPQIMGDLPRDRVTPALPFENSGVDFAGPFRIRLVKGRGSKAVTKAYVAVFVCLSVRAVHLELVEDYSTEAFIAAFKRFTARRGHCSLLRSDQGTNFIGADVELKKRLDAYSKEFKSCTQELSTIGTCWKFNPPAAPHFGGIWEAAVKSFKFHLKRLIGEHVLTFVEFTTILCEIEACLNSRPLTSISTDELDYVVLTPANFLIQRSSFLVPEPTGKILPYPTTKRWLWMTSLVQQFWKVWTGEYLQALQERRKWTKTSHSFASGDVVLLKNENNPPSRWPLAVIVKTHPGPDGVVRVVDVKTATNTLSRPTVKLVPLFSSTAANDCLDLN